MGLLIAIVPTRILTRTTCSAHHAVRQPPVGVGCGVAGLALSPAPPPRAGWQGGPRVLVRSSRGGGINNNRHQLVVVVVVNGS